MPNRLRLPSISFLVLLAAGVYLTYMVHEVLIPFALSFALAYLANPLVNYFEAPGLRRDHVVLSIFIILAVAIYASANYLLPATTAQLAILQGKAPLYLTQVQHLAASVQVQLAHHLPMGQQLVESWNMKMYGPLMEQLPKLPSYLLGLFPFFSLLFLVPWITFWLLSDTENILQEAIQFCPSRYVEQGLHLFSEIDTSLGNYIRGAIIIALVIGATSFVGLWLLGVDYALAISVLVGISSFVPYLGALMGIVVGATVAFFQFHYWLPPVQVVLLFIGIRFADEALVQPLVSRHAVHLHPLVYLLALMVGGKLFGFVGLLFAVPAACVTKTLLRVAWDWITSETRLLRPEPMYGTQIPYC